MPETKAERITRLIEDVVEISRATLPMLANKPLNEKTMDEEGLELIMSGVVFMYDKNTPDEDQLQQLKEVAATCAQTYRDMRPYIDDESLEDDEQSLFNLCTAFLHLWRRNIDFGEGQTKQ